MKQFVSWPPVVLVHLPVAYPLYFDYYFRKLGARSASRSFEGVCCLALRASSGKHARLSGFVLRAVTPFSVDAVDVVDAPIYFFCGHFLDG